MVMRVLRRERVRLGGEPVLYNWRYFDGAGGDVTAELVREAVQVRSAVAATTGGVVLLTVDQVAAGWRIGGGHLGDQADGDTLTTDYGSPYDAMAAVAALLGLAAREH